MYPELFRIGPIPVYSYGTLIVIGFLAALGIIRLRIRKYALPFEKIIDLAFGLLIWGFVGAKFFHWIIIPGDFLYDVELLFSSPGTFVKNLGNGFEFFGGIFSGVLFFTYFSRRHKLPVKETLDLITPAIPLAHMFGRFGCFMAGCCYGKPAPDLSWAVVFAHPKTLAPPHIPLHPTQIYEAVLLFILTVSLLLFEQKIRHIPGRMISFYILGYTVIRFLVEYYRADNRGIIPGVPLSGTQIIAMFAAAGSGFWLLHVHKANTRSKDRSL
jgi:phosphatidylglycerol---prolipoprotein diacylglyceryl transferase